MGLLGNIFAAPGSSAAYNRNDTQAAAANQFSGSLKQFAPTVNKQIGYAGSLEPGYESQMNQALSGFGQSATDAGIRKFGNQASERAGQNAQQAGLVLGSQGASPGAQQGATLGAFQGAQQATNQFAQQQNSPEAINERYQHVLQLYQSGMSIPAIQAYLQLGQGVYGQPTPYVGKGVADVAGSALGSWAGGGFKH